MIRKSTTLKLTREGYLKALSEEPTGLLMELIEFRAASDSQPQALGVFWGKEVYRGRISDYELIGNTILLTCAIPPHIDPAVIDSLSIIGVDETIIAQDFITARRKEASATTFIYAYLNCPTAIEPVEIGVRTQWTFPQVQNYFDLPKANTARKYEYVVNNGHCGLRDDYPQYLPSMVMLSSPEPKTVVFPPAEPFLDPDIGTLAPGEYHYSVTALNAHGESMPSPTHSITLTPLQPPQVYADPDLGALPSGTYYYQVCAVGAGNGTTLPSIQVEETVEALHTPIAPSLIILPGGLDQGIYYYAVTALSSNGETLPSNVSSIAVPDDSGIEISWMTVPNAIGYSIYRGTDPTTLHLLAQVDAGENVMLDWGASTDPNRSMPTFRTDCGIRISWDQVPGAIGYEVYGRSAGGGKLLLAAVPDNVFFYIDRGEPLGTKPMPSVNTTSSAVEVKWSRVPGATGYRVYGRTRNSQRRIMEVGDVTSFIDTGFFSPTALPPNTNQTAEVEWQLVDGTLVYRGPVAETGSDWFTIPNYKDEGRDLAFATVTTGSGRYQVRRIRYDKVNKRIQLLDHFWNFRPSNGQHLAVWAASGCCGAKCPEYVEGDVIYQPPPPPPPRPPKYAHLGVHICGVFLGAPRSDTTPRQDANRPWVTRNNHKYVDSGLMDYIFCDGNGKTDLVTRIDNVIATPHGNRAPVGDYSSIRQSFANSVKYTIDSIAIPAGLRVIIYRNPNFTGPIIFDREGPYYLVNGAWRHQSDYSWALDPVIWNDPTIGDIIPPEYRYWSDDDLRELWKNGSMQIVRTYQI